MANQTNSKLFLVTMIAGILAAFLSFGSVIADAQTPTPAPVPSDFASAQTIFLAGAGAPALGPREKLAVGMMYNSFYQQLTAWNKYKLLASPADADLLLEISIVSEVGDVSRGSSFNTNYIKLDVRDRRTQALLWKLDEPLKGAVREKTFQKNVSDSIILLLDDLKALAAGKQPSSAPDATPSTQP